MKQLCMIILMSTALVMGGTAKSQKATTSKKTTTKSSSTKTKKPASSTKSSSTKTKKSASSTKSADKNTAAKKAVKTTVIAAKAVFRKTPSEKGAKLAALKKGDQIVVTNSVSKPFIKAKFQGKIGYVKINAIKRTDTINKWVGTSKVISSGNKTSTTSKTSTATKSSTAKKSGDTIIGTYNGKKIYRGPKGGNYYLANGKKTYLTKEQKTKVKPL